MQYMQYAVNTIMMIRATITMVLTMLMMTARYKSSAETVSELIQKPLPFDRKDLRLSRRYRSSHGHHEHDHGYDNDHEDEDENEDVDLNFCPGNLCQRASQGGG